MTNEVVTVPDVIGDALSRFGKSATIDIEADDARSQAALNVYNGTVSMTFGFHQWSFLKSTIKCDLVDKGSFNIDTNNPWPNGYSHCHRLPGTIIGFVGKFLSANNPGAKISNFEREGELIFSQYEDVWVTASFVKDPQYWPLPWREAFTVLLAGRLSVPETHNVELEDKFLTEALGTPSERKLPGGMFGRLVAQDLAENPPDSPIRHGGPLTNVRQIEKQGSAPWYGTY
ncbi:MAG: hypothetical protein AAF478_03495 [Pseudomonadota bacterium]